MPNYIPPPPIALALLYPLSSEDLLDKATCEFRGGSGEKGECDVGKRGIGSRGDIPGI